MFRFYKQAIFRLYKKTKIWNKTCIEETTVWDPNLLKLMFVKRELPLRILFTKSWSFLIAWKWLLCKAEICTCWLKTHSIFDCYFYLSLAKQHNKMNNIKIIFAMSLSKTNFRSKGCILSHRDLVRVHATLERNPYKEAHTCHYLAIKAVKYSPEWADTITTWRYLGGHTPHQALSAVSRRYSTLSHKLRATCSITYNEENLSIRISYKFKRNTNSCSIYSVR
jgi:hypothetical protein